MNRVIEIIRKLAIVLICGSIGLLGIFLVASSNAETAAGKSDKIAGVALIAVTFVAYKVINWVFSSKENSD